MEDNKDKKGKKNSKASKQTTDTKNNIDKKSLGMNLRELEKEVVIGVVVLILLLTLIPWVPDIMPSRVTDFFTRGSGGVVIVDSPEIYSRERLINDRFSQSLWLEEQLEVSRKDFGNQITSDLHTFMESKSSLKMTMGAGEQPPADQSEAEADGSSAGKNNARESDDKVSVTPIEQFRDMLAYREEVRTEMMETMLDDRHDIAGNTLYRLKFDVTAIPQQNVNKFAAIQVRLSKPEYCKDFNLKSSKAMKCLNVDELLGDWLALIEEDINSAVDKTVQNFRSMKLRHDEFVDFSNFLDRKILAISKDEVLDVKTFKNTRNGWLQASNVDGECLSKYKYSYDDAAFLGKSEDVEVFLRKLATDPNPPEALRKRLVAFMGAYRNKKSDLKPEDGEETNSMKSFEEAVSECYQRTYSFFDFRVLPEVKSRYIKLQESLYKYVITNYLDHKDAESVKSDRVKPAVKTWLKLVNETGSNEMQPNESDSKEKQPRARILRLPPYVSDRDNRVKDIKTAQGIELGILRNAVVDYWIDRYTREPAAGEETSGSSTNDNGICTKLGQDYGEGFKDVYLSCFAEFEPAICDNGVYHCTIKVVPKRNVEEKRKVSEIFQKMLTYGESFYSYAITPKEKSQRLHAHEAERRQKMLAISLIAKYSNGLDSSAVEQLTELVSGISTQVEQIQRKPLVLSFGRGQSVFYDPVTEEGQTDKEEKRIETDFGWVLGPKDAISIPDGRGVNFVQSPVQNALSAIVSIPSWWTALDITVDTCWIDQDQVGKVLKNSTHQTEKGGKFEGNDAEGKLFHICRSSSIKPTDVLSYEYVIRVPGTINELSRKFGYQIERVPSLDLAQIQGPMAEFHVGQKSAKLLIEGSELWRSTVVTLGSQKANEIEVLPNMKGIIAHFDQIEPPQKRMVDEEDDRLYVQKTLRCTYDAIVTVWTSEGKTDEPAYVRIFANNTDAEDRKKDLATKTIDAKKEPETGQPGFNWCAEPVQAG